MLSTVGDEDGWQCYFSGLWFTRGNTKVQAIAQSRLTLHFLHRFRSQCSKLRDVHLHRSRLPLIGEYKQII